MARKASGRVKPDQPFVISQLPSEEEINQIFHDAKAAGRGGFIRDAFSGERIDALAGLMKIMGQPMTDQEIRDLKEQGE